MKGNRCFALLLMIFLAGCAGKENLIVLTPDANGTVGAIQFKNEKGEVVLDERGKAIVAKDCQSPPSATMPIDEAVTQSIFREALSAKPLAPQSFILYFEFDSNNLTAESNKLIEKIHQAARDRDSHDISVIGHTDRAGDHNYNLALSMQRASTIRGLLVEVGIKSEFIQISSHGEGNPLIPTADNVAEARNRRVEVVVR
ncbi:MAG: OmpA family protein [Proteobacteria bacterium]|nr:OmpA family protein [Pseudomonadota bacterium]MBU4009801.1 OmpA family protein [Pseudomonadota bacterium]